MYRNSKNLIKPKPISHKSFRVPDTEGLSTDHIAAKIAIYKSLMATHNDISIVTKVFDEKYKKKLIEKYKDSDKMYSDCAFE